MGGELLPPCVRGVVPPPPLRDEDTLPACGVRGSFGRLENASVPPDVGGGAPAPAACAAAEVFGFTFASIFEDAPETGAAAEGSFNGMPPLQHAERRVSQVA